MPKYCLVKACLKFKNNFQSFFYQNPFLYEILTLQFQSHSSLLKYWGNKAVIEKISSSQRNQVALILCAGSDGLNQKQLTDSQKDQIQLIVTR